MYLLTDCWKGVWNFGGLNSTEEQLAFVEGSRLRQMLRGVNAIANSKPVESRQRDEKSLGI